jgi:RNase adaptor protein for sRNA GlmZ degradation
MFEGFADMLITTHFALACSLPNPPNRKGKTGLDKDLVKELFAIKDVGVIYNRIKGEIESILASHNVDENGLELRIGIGCHSGKHRSVAFVEQLAWEMWMPPKGASQVRPIREHRDIKKKGSEAHKRQHKR